MASYGWERVPPPPVALRGAELRECGSSAASVSGAHAHALTHLRALRLALSSASGRVVRGFALCASRLSFLVGRFFFFGGRVSLGAGGGEGGHTANGSCAGFVHGHVSTSSGMAVEEGASRVP